MDAAVAAAQYGQTALALRLAKHLAPPPPGAVDDAAAAGGGNVAFSPVSVHAALALATAGARGATLAQLLAFLGAPSAASLADLGRRVAHTLLADDRSGSGFGSGSRAPRVLFGGGVWVDASRGGLSDAFRDVAAECYRSEAQTVSFASKPGEAVRMINEWVKKATDNLIDSVISTADIAADTDLVLANAVYFKAEWMEPFQPGGRSTFHLLDGGHTEAEFMSMSYYTLRQVACMDGFKVLKIPYKANGDGGSDSESTQYSMFVFLPDTCRGMATMVDVVTASPAFMYSVLAQMKLRWVNLRLPKFKITFNWENLRETLYQLGLTLPFSPEAADLRGMCADGDDDEGDGKTRRQAMFLSKVAHMAVVNVNEKGTEAAAVSFKLRGGGGPDDIVEFTADHPFTFFIMEERSGVIVFVGHVLDPTK